MIPIRIMYNMICYMDGMVGTLKIKAFLQFSQLYQMLILQSGFPKDIPFDREMGGV